MKTYVNRICFFAFVLMCSLEVRASAVVWSVAGLSGGGANYYIGSNASPNGDAAVEMLILDGGDNYTLSAQGYSTGIGHIWYEAQVGAPVNAAAVAGAQPFCNAFTAELGSINMTVGQPFYLAFALYGDIYHPDQIYGWAKLFYDGTTLTLLDSAAETTGVGIYTGTYTAIPEPCMAGLALTGLAVMAIRRRLRWSK